MPDCFERSDDLLPVQRRLGPVNTPRILVIQPDPTAPPERLGEWLTDKGAELDIYLAPDDGVPENIDDYHGMVCLGGGPGASDDPQYPWLADLRSLLGTARHQNMPTLGVSLGAQLLAMTNGGKVLRGPEGPEAGPGLVAKKDAAWQDPLFAELPLMPDVVQFHLDVIDQLPPNAELLASAPQYSNQAYRLDRVLYGLQFHIETTPSVVRQWIAASPGIAEAAREGAFDEERLAQLHDDIAETWRPFAHRFVDLAAGRIEPAEPKPRTLPLA